MANYKVQTVKSNNASGPEMEFTAKDDLSGSEIAEKFAKMNKAAGFNVFRKSGDKWICIVTEMFSKKSKSRVNKSLDF